MEPASISVLLGGLAECMEYLIRIAEVLLQLISQGQEAACVQQNNIVVADTPPPDEDSLPDLGDLSDLEAILDTREDEALPSDEVTIDIDELYEDVLSVINNDLANG
ncbi:putative uncharacterized protein TRPC5OS [Cynocephalus volans]|uniref:putative uncharacterized protein TRPC5OS n=1 Tax=Cynocephalus volans TaxID=110931 RepID=UPI002FC90C27